MTTQRQKRRKLIDESEDDEDYTYVDGGESYESEGDGEGSLSGGMARADAGGLEGEIGILRGTHLPDLA